MLLLVSSALAGLAAAGLGSAVLTIATCARDVDPQLGRFEESRRRQIRERSWVYRVFEPLIDELAARRGDGSPELLQSIQWQLTASAEPAPWRPPECLAAWRIEAWIAAAIGASVGWLLGGLVLALVAGAIGFFFRRSSRARDLRKRAERRRLHIRRQLAGAVDLLALMMEVGGGFLDGLATVARRVQGTPLGDELGPILADVEAGRTRKDALRSFAERVSDDDTSQLVFALIQGEELGTPMVTILRAQAEQMRQKRSQWAEKASQEAQVTLAFPAMVIMLACLIIVAAPFILVAVMGPR
jgi:tight adherence protein C